MTPDFDLSRLLIILLALGAICSLFVIFIYCPFVRRVWRRRRQCRLMPADEPGMPDVSVIVYSQDEAERLETVLPAILNQNYPGNFEVIVVNEGDSGDVRNVIAAMQAANRNLYLTFTPEGARNLSRKKLALTLGIKAARHDIVVLTTTDAIISSDLWLKSMMRHFAEPTTGIVLGYASPTDSESSRLSRKSAYDFAAESVSWLSAAIGYRPYRGSELNLAYRKELFFANKGFSRSLNLCFGDDDIFISEIANRRNTVVELSPESIIRFDSYDLSKSLRDSATRHRFTSRFIHNKPISVLAAGETALWIAMTTACAAVALDYRNPVTDVAAGVILVAAFTSIALSWRKATSALGLRRLTLTAPFLTFARPFARLSVRLSSQFSRQKKYTWD